jgi:hypothetical protein
MKAMKDWPANEDRFSRRGAEGAEKNDITTKGMKSTKVM